MIFFCEDCGAKNSLTEEYISNGLVTFRCRACNYLNSYPLPGTSRIKQESPADKEGKAAIEKRTGENPEE